MRPSRASRQLLLAGVLLVVAISFDACSSGTPESASTSTSSTSAPSQFQVATPQGQVSASLDGTLPPKWPSDAPVPPGAEPAGSGSLVGGSTGVVVGIYRTSKSPHETFGYYTSNASVSVESQTSVGVGSAFVGTAKITEPESGDVVVVSHDGSTYIVLVLETSGTSAGSTATSTSLGSSS